MKIREGFVSNSSSSSFCILGIRNSRFNFDDINDIVYKLNHSQNDISYCWEDGIYDYVDDKIMGVSADGMPEDITINNLKIAIKYHFKEYLNIELSTKDISWYLDGGYNG